MKRGSINLLYEIKTLYHIWNFFNTEKPEIVHLVTIKPYLYGGLISRLTKVPCLVTAISGLGTLFIGKNFKSKILRKLLYPIFKFAFNHSNQTVITQNKDDLNVLVDWGVLKKSKVRIIKGSGVNLNNFTNFKEKVGITTVCLASRLLRDKGIYEYVEAAKILKARGIKAKFKLAGDLDIGNPTSLNKHELNKIKKNRCVEILGYVKDIPSLYENSHIICLPSYREGLPKGLLEAAAASRAIVTTDVPGCRDSIIPNKTGLLVPVNNSEKLANALQILIENPKNRIAMGKAGRLFAEKEFSIEKIVNSHIEIYSKLVKKISFIKRKSSSF